MVRQDLSGTEIMRGAETAVAGHSAESNALLEAVRACQWATRGG
jgi:hypothetical protein